MTLSTKQNNEIESAGGWEWRGLTILYEMVKADLTEEATFKQRPEGRMIIRLFISHGHTYFPQTYSPVAQISINQQLDLEVDLLQVQFWGKNPSQMVLLDLASGGMYVWLSLMTLWSQIAIAWIFYFIRGLQSDDSRSFLLQYKSSF